MRLTNFFLSAALWLCLLPASAQYARFSRTTDTILVNGNTGLSNAATFEARVLLTANTQGNVLQESGSFESKTLLIGATALFGVAVGSGGSPGWNIAVTLPLRRWHHIAYVYNGTQDRLYLNGTLIASRNRSATIGNSDGYFSIGAHGANSPSFLGYLDTVRMSDVVRYTGNTFTPPMGDLPLDEHTQLLYNFNEPVGSATVTDLSVLENNGTFGAGFPTATRPEIVAAVPETGSVTGFVRLIGSTDVRQNITFEFRPQGGGASFQRQQVLVPVGIDTGSFYQSGIPAGTYDIAIKGHPWLQYVRHNVVISNSTMLPLAELGAGDLNNDNSVDALDLALMIDFFNVEGDA